MRLCERFDLRCSILVFSCCLVAFLFVVACALPLVVNWLHFRSHDALVKDAEKADKKGEHKKSLQLSEYKGLSGAIRD